MASLFFSLWRYVGCGGTLKYRTISNLCSQTTKEDKEGGAVLGFVFILFTHEY